MLLYSNLALDSAELVQRLIKSRPLTRLMSKSLKNNK